MVWPIRFVVDKCIKDIQRNLITNDPTNPVASVFFAYESEGYIFSQDKTGPFGCNWWRWGN